MDWIRRNWPDLLIGFALLAVISGIVATLLTGGSFFPLGGGGQADSPRTTVTQTTPQDPRPAADDPVVPAQDGPEVSALPVIGNGEQAGAGDALADDGPVDPFAELTEDPQELPTVVALRPGADDDGAEAADTPAQSAAQEPATETANQTPGNAQAQAPAQDTPAAEQQQITSGNAPSSQQPYTVGVGAFRDAANAQRQADVFRQAGYPVVVANQDELTVVLLGPYANDSEAERVSGEVANGGFGVSPLVYTYQGDDAGAATSTASEAPAQQATTQSPAAEPAATPAPMATAAGRYLQVGAYSSTENAAAQVDVLESLGFDATQEQDGNLIRVLVGPYGADQLEGAQDRLAAQGIDSVPH